MRFIATAILFAFIALTGLHAADADIDPGAITYDYLEEGSLGWTNRAYAFENIPDNVRGKYFTQHPLLPPNTTYRVVVTEPGTLYLIYSTYQGEHDDSDVRAAGWTDTGARLNIIGHEHQFMVYSKEVTPGSLTIPTVHPNSRCIIVFGNVGTST